MSKIGKMPIALPAGVSVVEDSLKVTVTGPKGVLTFTIFDGISLSQKDNMVTIGVDKDKASALSSMYGLARAQIANMIEGVSVGFTKKLELTGVGYRAQIVGKDLQLSVGFSHTVTIESGEHLSFAVAENVVSIMGIDKNLVGNTAAKIRAIRPPEPYKGKGIAYVGEKIRRKAGKAAKAVGTK